MHLLTWHGTVLRVEVGSQRLIHAAPFPQRPTGRDFTVPPAAAALTEALELPNAGGLALVAGTLPGTVGLTLAGRPIAARAGQPELGPAAEDAGADGLFLALAPETLAGLRALLGAPHRLAGGDQVAVALEPGFRLRIGDAELELGAESLLPLPGGTVLVVGLGDAPLTLEAAGPAAHPDELALLPAPELPAAADLSAWGPDTRVDLPGTEELAFPPLTHALSARDWPWLGAEPPRAGAFRLSLPALRAGHAFILSLPGAEGLALTDHGTLGGEGALPALLRAASGAPDAAVPLAREGETVFLPRALLARAPYLTGPHALFWPAPPLSDYRIMTEAIPALVGLLPHLPPDITLLRPPMPKASDRLEDILDVFGLGALPCVAPPAPVAQVEELWHVTALPPADTPADFFRAARDRARAALGLDAPAEAEDLPRAGLAARPRLVTWRHGQGSFADPPAFAALAQEQGLTVIRPGALSLRERAVRFAEAGLIVGAAPADLGPLMACAPGTAVIELCPDDAYHPQVNTLCDKLGLVHAVLPCPADDAGRLTVPRRPLAALIRQLGLLA